MVKYIKEPMWIPTKWDNGTFTERHKLTPSQIRSLRAEFKDLVKWWKQIGKPSQMHPPYKKWGEGYGDGHICTYNDLIAMLSKRPLLGPSKRKS